MNYYKEVKNAYIYLKSIMGKAPDFRNLLYYLSGWFDDIKIDLHELLDAIAKVEKEKDEIERTLYLYK